MRNATNITVSTFGTIMGLAGIEHGIGEVLQGNVAPAGIMFPSWPGSAFFAHVSGEPAMSLIPNLLLTGILTLIFSTLLIAWAILFVQSKNGGLVLILISIIMLLVGGGIFPPILGILIGIVGTRINAPSTGWSLHLPAGLGPFLGKAWPWSFGICLVAWLLLFPGTNILGYFFGVDDMNLTVMIILLAFGSLASTIFAGLASDTRMQTASPSGTAG